MTNQNQSHHQPSGNGRDLKTKVSSTFYNELVELAEQRRRSLSDTARMLVILGMRMYRLQARFGIIRKAQREEFQARIDAVAERMQAERKEQRRPKKGCKKPAPAILLLDGNENFN